MPYDCTLQAKKRVAKSNSAGVHPSEICNQQKKKYYDFGISTNSFNSLMI